MTKLEIFTEHLPEEFHEFFLRMNKLMEREEVIVQYENNRVTYFPDTKLKQQPLILRYIIDNDRLTVELKLNHIDCYSDLIDKMPDHIKRLFRSVKNCKREECKIFDKKCGIRRVWVLDGEHYYLCSYKYYFNPDISNPDDTEYYAKIIMAEVKASKEKKKLNTAIYE